jgi:hypothetical protein
MNVVFLNRRREARKVPLGPAVSWPRTEAQAQLVIACRDRAKDNGNPDLAEFYDFQLANAALRNGIQVDGPGSAA